MELNSSGKCIEMTENFVIIRTHLLPIDPASHGTLAHEIFHAIDFVLRDVGMVLSEQSYEAYAYLIGYLTKEIYKKL